MNQAEIKPIEARIMVKDGLTEVIIRKVEFINGIPMRSFLTKGGNWMVVGFEEMIPTECYLHSTTYSPEPENPVMDKINSWQLFGRPFVFSHPEIFSWEDCGNSSSSTEGQPKYSGLKCWKCGKDMERDDGGSVIKGIQVTVCDGPAELTPADIEYNNRQLGKYGNGQGQCNVAICYECYIDNLFGVGGQ